MAIEGQNLYQGRHDENTEATMEMGGWELQAWMSILKSGYGSDYIRFDFGRE
jgi:hypothetical protein